MSEVDEVWEHKLLEVNVDEMTAVCAQCGPVPLRRKGKDGEQHFRCGRFDATRQRRRIHSDVSYRFYLGTECERCGFVAIDPVQLDIHHRDGYHSNNDPENLATLCANCHRLEHVTAIVAMEVWT